ncbi:MAG TPA: glycosyltransferase, partial [Rhodothermales bacterium]
MAYLLTAVEATRPPLAIELSLEHEGVAVEVRDRGRPVGFWMEVLPPAARIPGSELTKRLEREAGRRTLEERIRSELGPPTPSAALPPLSIAICTRNRPQSLARCLRSIDEAIDRAAGCIADVEVLVV